MFNLSLVFLAFLTSPGSTFLPIILGLFVVIFFYGYFKSWYIRLIPLFIYVCYIIYFIVNI